MSAEYVPGVCNIGQAEIAKRRQAGWVGVAATLVLWIILILLDVPHVWRLALFIPVTLAATGFLQAAMHFCAGFGFNSVFNFGELGKTESVQQDEYRAKDRRKSWQILIYSVLIGIVVALLAYLVPL